MAKINVINNASGDLTIDPGAAGDSFIQFDINTVGEFRIGVDDTDDSFRLSQGSALGTNDTFIIDTNGIRLMPLLPCFLAINSATDSNVTGDGTVVSPVDFDTEVFDQGTNFAGDTFTAPVTGRYLLGTSIFFQQIGLGHTSGNIAIVTSNRSYVLNAGDPGARRSPGGANFVLNTTVIADMDASDTAFISLVIAGDTKTVDLFGAAVHAYTFFCGCLIT